MTHLPREAGKGASLNLLPYPKRESAWAQAPIAVPGCGWGIYLLPLRFDAAEAGAAFSAVFEPSRSATSTGAVNT